MSKDSLGKILKTGKDIDPSELKKKLKSAVFSQPLYYLEGKTTEFSPFQYDWVANTNQDSFSELEDVINIDVIELTSKKNKKKKKKQKSKAAKFKASQEEVLIKEVAKVDEKKEVPVVELIETLPPKEVISIKSEDRAEDNLPFNEVKTEIEKGKASQKTKKSKKPVKIKAKKIVKFKRKEKKVKKHTFKKRKEVTSKTKQEEKQDSFTSWLNNLKNKEVAVDQEFTVKTAIAKPLKKAKKAKKFTSKKKDKSKKKLSSNKKELKQKISTSIMSKEDIATETLALLYAEQGYNKKAITIYERLSLKNPEKSSFFADQIQNLKKEI